jgi:superfamily II DNA or RNA helicase
MPAIKIPKTLKIRPCKINEIRNPLTLKCEKTCIEGKELNPVTNRCNNLCKSNQLRDIITGKCENKDGISKKQKNVKSVKRVPGSTECPPGTVYNLETKRCRKERIIKECKENQMRNPRTGRCISIARYEIQQEDGNLDSETTFVIHAPTNSPMDCVQRSNLKLKDYQARICQFMDTNRGIIVAHGVGSGKTLTAVSVSQCFLDKNPTGKVIVTTPKSLIFNFKKELNTYGIEQDDKRYEFMTHEKLCNIVKKNKLPLSYFNNCLLIIDEIHNFRTQPLNRTRAYYAIQAAHSSLKVLGLTATPIVNGLMDLKNPLSMITGDNIKAINKSPSFDSLKQYKSLFSVFYRNENDPAYPTKIVKNVDIRMTPDYFKKYLNIERSQKKTNLPFDLGFRMAVNKLDDSEESPKVQWTIQLLENGLKTLVYSSFKDSGVDFLAKYLERKNIKFEMIDGSKSIEERKKTVLDYNNNLIQVLLITKAGSEGLDLKETRQVVLFEPVWNDATEVQIIGRAVRRGSHMNLPLEQRNVTVYKLLMIKPDGAPTIDHKLTNIINEKKQLTEDSMTILKELSIEMNHTFQ